MQAWKWIGLAGIAGIAAVGMVSARKHRTWSEADPDELREKLHARLAAADGDGDEREESPEGD